MSLKQKLQTNEEITQDTVAKAILEMAQPTHSVVMPKIPEIVSFWPAMDAVINDTYKGNIKPADYQAKLDKLVQDTSKEERIKSKNGTSFNLLSHFLYLFI